MFFMIAAGAAVILVISAVGHFSSHAEAGTLQTPVLISQPDSAAVVAHQLHCGDYHDLGSGLNVGVVDSGFCWINNAKYAINTFVSKNSRDAWLRETESMGVDPRWETDTSVTYPSIG
jgi:hypothetical protein